MRIRLPKKSGFTIIELLVVVSIIVIIVSIATSNSSRVLKNSKDASLMLTLTHLRSSIYQSTLISNGKFPESLDDLVPDFLNKAPKTWKGSNSTGKIGYNNESGTITLLDLESENPSKDKDVKGREYGTY